MSSKYKVQNPEGLYFITSSVIDWIDLFIRNEYRQLMLTSWKYCMDEKGLDVYAWCIMTSHFHMIVSSRDKPVDHIVRDMKSFTSRHHRKEISSHPQESRKEWMMRRMHNAGKFRSNNKDFQLWQQDFFPIELTSNEMMEQKLNYIHNNPVEAGFVDEPAHYLYSSARDYAGGKGLLDGIVLLE